MIDVYDYDRRPAMPVRELLETQQDDPEQLFSLAHSAGLYHGVDRSVVKDYVLNTVGPPLRAGWIRAIHFYNSAPEPFLTDELSADEVLGLVSVTLDQFDREGFDELDYDFWFESTEAGDLQLQEWQRDDHA